MWNPFKRKYKVPVEECFESIQAAMLRDRTAVQFKKPSMHGFGIWEWLECQHGVKREWSWRTHKNYLVFDSERDFLLFLIKL
jgi:hypothetical protein